MGIGGGGGLFGRRPTTGGRPVAKGGYFTSRPGPVRPTGQNNPVQSFARSATVVLNASGYGYCTITCPTGVKWETNLLSVSTNAAATSAQPTCVVYRGTAPSAANYSESTRFGNGRTSDSVYTLQAGDALTAEWTGGTAGKTATFVIRGMQQEV